MGDQKNNTFTAARGTMGAIGLNRSNAWNYLENDNGAYLRSMDKDAVLPPSLFVSERDRTRYGKPMPIAERCIEDHGNPDALSVGEWDIGQLDAAGPAPEVTKVDLQQPADGSSEGRSLGPHS